MARALTEQEREQFLADLHIAVVSVASDNGRPPHTTPVWYAYQPGGTISFFSNTQGRTSRKAKLIEKSGALSVSVQKEDFPYKYVTVEGTVVKADRQPDAEELLAVLRRYLPEDAAQGFVAEELARPGSQFVLYTVRPDRWLTNAFD